MVGLYVKAAVDFVGAEKTIEYAFNGAKKGGQIVIVGLFGGAFHKPIPMFPLTAKSICGSFVGNLEETKEMLEIYYRFTRGTAKQNEMEIQMVYKWE